MLVRMIRLVAAATLAAVLLLDSGSVSAQAAGSNNDPVATGGEEVDGDIKGTIGLGLIGMEVGLLLPPLFKLHDQWWAWTVFPVLGAAGGAAGGYFAFESGTPDRKVTIPIFAAGVALVIPAIVGSLAIKARRDARAMNAQKDVGTGLVRFNRGGTFVRAPALSIASGYQNGDMRLGVAPQRATNVHVPLLSGRF